MYESIATLRDGNVSYTNVVAQFDSALSCFRKMYTCRMNVAQPSLLPKTDLK